ncbi:MAG: 3,4-dihydroxy-2-butanone-4-phosphate synthase [Candidatus Altiarchaeota archaeon]
MLGRTVDELRRGRMILLHDSAGRENEVDMVVHASAVTPDTIWAMRQHGGGLICLAIGGDVADRLNLPYITDLMAGGNDTVKKLIQERTAYGDKPAFSLSVNHRETYTGITDKDRALTITEFAKLEESDGLTKNFYAPGHVHLLIAKDLSTRRGHTELSIELAKKAGMKETMVLCEMMGDDHNALTLREAERYAKRHSLALLDGGLL